MSTEEAPASSKYDEAVRSVMTAEGDEGLSRSVVRAEGDEGLRQSRTVGVCRDERAGLRVLGEHRTRGS